MKKLKVGVGIITLLVAPATLIACGSNKDENSKDIKKLKKLYVKMAKKWAEAIWNRSITTNFLIKKQYTKIIKKANNILLAIEKKYGFNRNDVFNGNFQ